MTSLIHRCDDTTARVTVTASPAPVLSGLSYFEQDAADRCGRLYPRQRDVLKLLGKGLSQKNIAAAMGISIHTVNAHLVVIYKKLDVSNSVEAAVLATKAGWL